MIPYGFGKCHVYFALTKRPVCVIMENGLELMPDAAEDEKGAFDGNHQDFPG